MPSLTVSVAVIALASLTAANLQINNWCDQDVYLWQSPGTCNQGPNTICDYNGGTPWKIPAHGPILQLDWFRDVGTAVKISKGSDFSKGILQFEYTLNSGGLWWDLSDLDGAGSGLVGTPFANDNVKISPTGSGEGTGTCLKIRCTAGQLCRDSYQHPDDVSTKYCPANTGDFYIDLCQPTTQFNAKRDAEVVLGAQKLHQHVAPQNTTARTKRGGHRHLHKRAAAHIASA